MYLHISDIPNKIHGVDYTKGLEDGRMCGRTHPYWTVYCRPILIPEKEVSGFKKENLINYDYLTEREKLILGEPIFWLSPLHRALYKVKRRSVVKEATIDVYGQEINRKTTVGYL